MDYSINIISIELFSSFKSFEFHKKYNFYNYAAKFFNKLKAAVNYINSGAFQEAINVLNGIDNRDGRWYYYSAQANSGAGNTATALEHAKHAVEIDPDNVAYQNLYRQLQSGGQWYAGRGQSYGRTTMNPGGYCMTLLCLNLCCGPTCGIRFC